MEFLYQKTAQGHVHKLLNHTEHIIAPSNAN